ncbi:MAG TPA: CvpA family protein [Dehalococcoidia bacterium]|nr:CvpA family protein [Dehalococcoidia bacterium]
MNGLDVLIGITLALGAYTGLRKGIVGMLLPLVGLVIGVYLAGRYYQTVAERVFRSQDSSMQIISFVLILLAVIFAASLVASLISRALPLILLGWLNGLLGGVLGILLAMMAWGTLLALLLLFPALAPEGLIGDSFLASVILERFPLLLALLPEEFDRVRTFFR